MKVNKLKITIDNSVLVDIDFEVNTSLALVGQSGSGKSLTLKALLGMLPSSMTIDLQYDWNFDLLVGKTVALIPQNPFTALSPLTKIKKQFFVDEERVEELFKEVGLSLELLDRFAPELSGGQLQRVVIAMALSNRPKLLLLDEPTTSLDPNTRLMIIDLIKKLQKKEKFKIIFVTHDVATAKIFCEDICVIRYGKVVESGKISEVIQTPTQKYTQKLIDANFANREFRE